MTRATQGLRPHEAAELDSLLAAHPELDTTDYEWAAAAVSLAALDSRSPMPERLRLALEQRAAEFIGGTGARPTR